MSDQSSPATKAPTMGRRRLLLLCGVPLALAALLFALKTVTMTAWTTAGRTAYAEGDFERAEARFALTRIVNVFEVWVAPFNEGDAQFGRGDFTGAATSFETALEDVPHEHECTVRINLALTHEAAGDSAVAKSATKTAGESYGRGREALALGRCLSDPGQGPDQARAARELDEQLARKQARVQGRPEPKPTPTPTPTPSVPPPPPTKQQADELAKLNDAARRLRNNTPQPVPTDNVYHW